MANPTTAFYSARKYDIASFNPHLKEVPFETCFHEFALNETTAPTVAGAQAVCAFVNDHLDPATLRIIAAQGVEMVALRCAGFNMIDLDVARELGMRVTRVPAYSPSAVAEHAVALLLALNRRIFRAFNRIRDHNFSLDGLVGFDIAGKTVGVIGAGKIGKKAARIMRGFESRVLVHDEYRDEEWARQTDVEYVSLEQLFRESDIITLHVPLLETTRFLINENSIAQMKDGVIIINTSRGKLVDTGALIEGLKSGRVGGVGLDVYEEEEQIFFHDRSDEILEDAELAYLLTFPNAIVTAHQAFLTNEALDEIASVTVGNLRAFFEGKPPLADTDLVYTD